MASETLKIDANDRSTVGFVTDDSSQFIVNGRIDNATKGLKVMVVGGGVLTPTTGQYKTVLTVGSSNADYITTGTNDDVQMQNAINAVSLAGGGQVLIKAGTYSMTNGITITSSNVEVIGQGMATLLQFSNNASPTTPNASMVSITGTGVIENHLKNLMMDGNKNNGVFANGINLSTPFATTDTHHVFEDLYIQNFKFNGVNVPVGSDTRVTKWNRIHIRFCEGNGWYMPVFCLSDSWFTNCIAEQVSFNGFYVGCNTTYFTQCYTFYAGEAVGSYHGFNIVAYNNQFSQCVAQDNFQSGFYGDNSQGYAANGTTFNGCIGDSNNQRGLKKYTFTVTSANATAGATYTNNAVTYTVDATIAGGTTLVAYGTGAPTASGTLTRASGTGDATIAFSSNVLSASYGDGFQGIDVTNWGITGCASFERIFPPAWTQRYGISLTGSSSKNSVTSTVFYGNGSGDVEDTSTGPTYLANNTYNSGSAPTTLPGAINMGQNKVNFGSGTASISGSTAKIIVDGGSNVVQFNNATSLLLNSSSPVIDAFSASTSTLLVQNSGGGAVQLQVNGDVGLGTSPSTTTYAVTPPAIAGKSSLRILSSSGTAPTSPVDGDMWYDGTNVKFRVGGTTKTFTLT